MLFVGFELEKLPLDQTMHRSTEGRTQRTRASLEAQSFGPQFAEEAPLPLNFGVTPRIIFRLDDSQVNRDQRLPFEAVRATTDSSCHDL